MIPILDPTVIRVTTPETKTYQTVDSILIGTKAIFVRTLEPWAGPKDEFTLHVYGPRDQYRFTFSPLTYGSKSVTGYHVLVPNDTTVISLESPCFA